MVTSAQRQLVWRLKNWVAHKAHTVLLVFRLSALLVRTASRNVPLLKLMVAQLAPPATTVFPAHLTSSLPHALSAHTVRTGSTLHALKVPLVTLFTVCLLTTVRLAHRALLAARVHKHQPPVEWPTTVLPVSPRQVFLAPGVLTAVTNLERLTLLSA